MIRLLLLLLVFATPAFAADWKPEHVTKTYAVSGTTPLALYTSIGESGPVIGHGRRTIAHTVWDLKWRRDYQPDGTGCVLKSALPFLTIITTLPKPESALSGETERRWRTFADGIEKHENVHGADIVAMTEQIIADTVGLRVVNDPGCKIIRAEVLARVQKAADDYKAKARAFDQVEMGANGTVQRLVLDLINP